MVLLDEHDDKLTVKVLTVTIAITVLKRFTDSLKWYTTWFT